MTQTFKEFDIDKDYLIDFSEFERCFNKRGYLVDKKLLKGIFDEIDAMNQEDKQDGRITKQEYKLWKQSKAGDMLSKATANGPSATELWHVMYNQEEQRYEFECEAVILC